MTNSLFNHARLYVSKGIQVIPLHYPFKGEDKVVCSCGNVKCENNIGKHPAGWVVPNGLKNASADLDVVARWFRYEIWNIGIITGRTSGVFGSRYRPAPRW